MAACKRNSLKKNCGHIEITEQGYVFPPPAKNNPPSNSRQGRAAVYTAAREPPSLRTGRALTGAVRRIVGNQGGNTTKVALRRLWSIMGDGGLTAYQRAKDLFLNISARKHWPGNVSQFETHFKYG